MQRKYDEASNSLETEQTNTMQVTLCLWSTSKRMTSNRAHSFLGAGGMHQPMPPAQRDSVSDSVMRATVCFPCCLSSAGGTLSPKPLKAHATRSSRLSFQQSCCPAHHMHLMSKHPLVGCAGQR